MERLTRNIEQRIKDNLTRKSMADCINGYIQFIVNYELLSCINVELTQEAVEYLDEYIDWDLVSYCVKMDSEFLEAHIDKLNFGHLSYNRHLPKEFIIKHLDKLDLYTLFYFEAVDIHFVCEYGKKDEIQHCMRRYNEIHA